MKNKHSFHIPVMGISFTIDSALKVARFGIDTVFSLSGQPLQEKLRKFYSEKHGIDYEEITEKDEDYRAKRSTAYLNFVDDFIKKTFEGYTNSPKKFQEEIEEHIDLLPDNTKLKEEFRSLLETDLEKCKIWVKNNLRAGSIDVNIMTKLDRENYYKGEKLSAENNDGHAALRGYAKSNLSSSLILSAGLNPRLFTYMEEFDDFYQDTKGDIKKKIVLKVSDYRSAMIQGKFLAKKGLWVSEYRIESGLNCGGHAFATDGFLMGPILSEFKNNKNELFESVSDVLETALEAKGRSFNKESLPFIFTAQGGVGTSEEHQFLLDEYDLDSVGWGSPFLLVPEATSVDEPTINRLIEAEEKDFYLSKLSPIGVRFNSLRGTSKDKERLERIAKGKPGSPCIEGNLALFNTEFTDKPICLASRQYQNLKIKELDSQGLEPELYQKKYDEIVDKACLCTGLVNSVLIVNNLETKPGNDGVSICPGPNMYYFKKLMGLSEIVDHIYGREEIPFLVHRPHMFIKELYAYVDYLSESIEDIIDAPTKKDQNKLNKFSNNLLDGIEYYNTLFKEKKDLFNASKALTFDELKTSKEKVLVLQNKIMNLELPVPVQSN